MSKKNNNKDVVQELIQSKETLATAFGCDNDFFFKPMTECEWFVRKDEDFHFLSYWLTPEKKVEAVVVKKSGEPMIYEKNGYTMVVAIDCVKIGFIFVNDKKLGEDI